MEFHARYSNVKGLELIDTCWNVNTGLVLTEVDRDKELIDTCWNVNEYKNSKAVNAIARINRYMLGCKYALINWY